MDIGEMVVHGWKFKLVDDKLSITSEQDPNVHLELEAKAAFSLLDYLYQYREKIHEEAQIPEGKSIEEKEVSKEKPGLFQPANEKNTAQGKVELL